MKSIALSLIVFMAAACSRAQWQETPRAGDLSQQNDPKPAPAPQPTPVHAPSSNFDTCASQTLSLEIDTAKSQDNVKDFKTTLDRYPQMKATQVAKTKKKTTYYLNALDAKGHACDDSACAEAAGWSQIQSDILDLNGMTLACNGQATLFDAPTESTDSVESLFQE